MKLNDLIKEPKERERIYYIFNSLKTIFPNTCYDERDKIVGIGEPDKQLFCYFKYGTNQKILVKFKSENGPIDLMGSNSDIIAALRRTTHLFQTTNMKKHGQQQQKRTQREQKTTSEMSNNGSGGALDNASSPNDSKAIIQEAPQNDNVITPTEKTTNITKADSNNNIFFDDEITKEAEFQRMLENLQPKHATTMFATIASRRLINALSSVGIIYVEDLFKWTYRRINLIAGFGKKMYAELCSILIALSNGDAFKELKWDFRVLELSAEKKLITNLEKTSEIRSYLYSINNDETKFAEGTVGRILCLRMKANEYSKFNLDTTIDIIGTQYFKNTKCFNKLATSVKMLILEIIKLSSKTERDIQICMSYFGLTREQKSLVKLAKKYGLSKDGIRQIILRSSKMVGSIFSLDQEDGLYKYIKKGMLLKTISNYGIEAFFVHLTLCENKQFVKIVQDILLYGIKIPEDFDCRVDTAAQLIKENFFSKTKEKVTFDFNEFDLMTDDNGELLTDVSLLLKLKEKRRLFSIENGTCPSSIYTNKQLVILATLKPVSKAMYTALSGFTTNNWDTYGYIFAKIIKEHTP